MGSVRGRFVDGFIMCPLNVSIDDMLILDIIPENLKICKGVECRYNQ